VRFLKERRSHVLRCVESDEVHQTQPAPQRIEALDWQEILRNLDERGNAGLPNVLTSQKMQGGREALPDHRPVQGTATSIG